MRNLLAAAVALVAAIPMAGQQTLLLTYSTYLNGTSTSIINDVTTDSRGFVYVVGSTSSADFPTANSLQPFSGTRDVFVTKLSPDGSQIVFSTFFGSGQGAGDSGNGIKVDQNGNIFFTGYYTTPGVLGDARNAFIAKLNPDGTMAGAISLSSSAVYADERTAALALDPQGNVLIAGTAYTNTIPIANGFQPQFFGSSTGFLVAVDPSLTQLLYSTYVGQSLMSRVGGVAVDSNGYAYLTGATGQLPTTPGVFQPQAGDDQDAFLVKIDPHQSGAASLVFATFLGGGQPDEGQGITVDPQGVAWITGYTQSFSGVGGAFPTTVTGFQRDLGYTNVATAYCHGTRELSFCPDAFIAGVSSDGTQLVYSSYLGGDGPDTGYAVTVDGQGAVYVSGKACQSFPVTANATQSSSPVCGTGFLSRIDPTQSGPASLVFSTFVGGSGGDQSLALTVDPRGNAWVAGQTLSKDFPLVAPLQTQPSPNGASAFVTRFSFTQGSN